MVIYRLLLPVLIPLFNLGLKPIGTFIWNGELAESHGDSDSTIFPFLLNIRQETLKFWEQDVRVYHRLEMFKPSDNIRSKSWHEEATWSQSNGT